MEITRGQFLRAARTTCVTCQRWAKPVAVSEFGSCTFEDAPARQWG